VEGVHGEVGQPLADEWREFEAVATACASDDE
jgi:hypothetical protein